MNAEQTDVMKTISAMLQAFDDRDIDRVMAAYRDDAIAVFKPGEFVSGLEAIRSKIEVAFAMNPNFEFSGHEVFVAGDTATHIGKWTMTVVLPDSKTAQDSNLSIITLKQHHDRGWLISIDNPYGGNLMKR